MTEIQGKSILVRVSARFELARVRVIGSRLYIHSIPFNSRAFARKRRKKFVIACLRHRFITTLRVSLEKESYDTKWFDYNDRSCTYSTPPPHWKLKGLKRRTEHKHTTQLTL